VYKSLVYETNSFIGHFILRDSHVRTHYDLTDYIKRDNIWEFLHEKFVKEIGDAQRLLIIGVGMEYSVISRVGQQLSALLGDELAITFITADDLSPGDRIPVDWGSRFEIAFVVTDIVNTGKTVDPWIHELNRTSNGRPVKVFTVAKMLNSPTEIAGVHVVSGVDIRRSYYPPKNCVLCAVGQPKTEVQKLADFRKISPEQLTPYDFWEMIKETQAFRRSDRDPQGRSLLFRIDTAQIVRRYSGWLSNVIRQKCRERWSDMRPDAVCTVAGEPGEAFADLVARSLNLQPPVKIPRFDLRRVTSTGFPPDVRKPFEGRESVLIVDDGINYGETVRRLIAYCRAAGAIPMGVLVLDSRLPVKASDGISALMGRHAVVALYNWPSRMRGL
jgi:orotate phosphoribosyltransferase-like protein